jgi:hypothetical protein
MLTTLWITQRENAYVEIDKWHCNSKRGEPLLAALEAAASPPRFLFRATTCYDHLRRHQLRRIGIEDLLNWKRSRQWGCLHCEDTAFWEQLDGDVLLPSVIYFKQFAKFRRAWGRSHREELNNGETMRVRNVIADVKFAKVIY